MKKKLYVFLLLLFATLPCFAQQKVTVSLDQQPIIRLFEAIENQTDYRIYCTSEVSDSLIISVNETNADPLNILQQTLQNTAFNVSKFQDAIYIIKDKELVTTLPKSFYGGISFVSDNEIIPVFERESKATSETLIYAIGDSKNPSASNVTMTGIVTNFKNGESMLGITLHIADPFIGATTDASGYYSLRLPPGRHELIIRGTGIKESKRQLMLFSDGKLDIELEEQVYSLSEVMVTAHRVDNVRSATIGVERLQMQNIKNIPTILGEADIIRIIMSLPGVKAAGEISSGYNVRGGASDQNLILYNEGTIYTPTHMFGLFSVFNPDVIDNMELYKSSIPAKYGGRISSVLDISTKEGNKKKFQGVASLGLLTSRLTLEAPLFKGKGSFIVAGRTTYSDWLLNMVPEKSGYNNGSAGFYDLNGSMNYRFNENNGIHLSTYYSRDRFSFDNKEQYGYKNANISTTWRHIFNAKLTSAYTAGYDHYSYDTKDTSDVFKAYSLNFAIDQMFGKADFSYYMNNNHTFNAGISSLFYQLKPGNYLPEHELSLVREERLQTEKALESAVYFSDNWEISPDFMVSAGIRYSMFNVLGQRNYNIYLPDYLPSLTTLLRTDSIGKGIQKTYHGPELRLSLRYILDENTSIKAGMNTMRQSIHKISNTTVMSPTDTWKLSDFNIRPQTGVQYVVGLFRNFANNTVESSVEVYYKTMNNYLDYRGGAELLMNHHIETEVAGVKGRAYGAELMFKKNVGKLNGWVSYTYSRTMLQRHKELSSIANTSDWYPSDFDKPHEVKLIGNYKLTHRFSLSLNCDYSTGRPITLPTSKYRYEGGHYIYFTERNKYRIPDFFRMDVSFNIEPGHHLVKLTHSYFTIGVYNITGRKNAYSVYYIREGGDIKGYKLSVFGVPIPYASFNIKF